MEGNSCRTIGTLCNCSGSQVCRIIRKFLETGSIDRKTGSGRKRKTSEKMDRLIRRQVRVDRKVSSYQIRKDLELNFVSVHTIRRRITETFEFKSYWATKKPFISDSNRRLLLFCDMASDFVFGDCIMSATIPLLREQASNMTSE